MNLYDDGFFVHIFKDFKSANIIFNLPNPEKRGKREQYLMSIIILEGNLNLELTKELLKGIVTEIKQINELNTTLMGEESSNESKLKTLEEIFFAFEKSMKPALNAVQIAEDRYKTLFHSAKDPILIIDKDSGFIIDANDQSKNYFKDHLGSSLKSLINTENYEKFIEKINIQILVENPSPFLTWIYNSKEEKVPFEINSSRIDFGDKKLLQLILHDISDRIEVEEELRNSERKLNTVLDNSPDFIIAVNPENKIQFMNHIPPNLSLNGVINKNVSEFLPPDDFLTYKQSFKRVFETGTPEQIYFAKGEETWFTSRVVPIIQNDEIAWVMLINSDVSENVKTQVQLEKSEKKYRHLMESAGDMIAIVNEKFEYEYVNDSFYNVMGYEKNEMVGKRPVYFMHPDDRLKVAKALRVSFKAGKGSVEYRYRAKDGKYHWVETHGRRFTDLDGKTKALMFIRNISDRKKSEQLLIESEKQYKTIIDSINDPIHVIDMSFKIKFANNAIFLWLKNHKIDSDIIGKTLFDAFPFLDNNKIREEYKQVITDKKLIITQEHTNFEGKDVYTEVRKIPILLDGEIIQIITIIHDITNFLNIYRQKS